MSIIRVYNIMQSMDIISTTIIDQVDERSFQPAPARHDLVLICNNIMTSAAPLTSFSLTTLVLLSHPSSHRHPKRLLCVPEPCPICFHPILMAHPHINPINPTLLMAQRPTPNLSPSLRPPRQAAALPMATHTVVPAQSVPRVTWARWVVDQV